MVCSIRESGVIPKLSCECDARLQCFPRAWIPASEGITWVCASGSFWFRYIIVF